MFRTKIVYRDCESQIPCMVHRKILNSVTCLNEYCFITNFNSSNEAKFSYKY